MAGNITNISASFTRISTNDYRLGLSGFTGYFDGGHGLTGWETFSESSTGTIAIPAIGFSKSFSSQLTGNFDPQTQWVNAGWNNLQWTGLDLSGHLNSTVEVQLTVNTTFGTYQLTTSGSQNISTPTPPKLATPNTCAASQIARDGDQTTWSLIWSAVAGVPASAQYQYNYRIYTGTWSAWSASVNTEQTSVTVPITTATGTKVQFRVRAATKNQNVYQSSEYRESSQYDISYNIAPTAPASISVPSNIAGGSQINISWSASADPDGNLAGYKLERRHNNGEWSQIYQGASTNTSDTVISGWTSVAYRVKAYDTEGAESTYTTSPTRSVQTNVPPNAPPSITVPLTITKGQTYSVTWSASTDPDGNLAGYRLERSTNGGTTYTMVYEGAALSYAQTAENWSTVKYRVRAYDDKNATSAWTTSPTRTVISNNPPVIDCDLSGDIGTKNTDFDIKYTVTDADDDTVTVTEKLDGVTIKSYTVTLGQEQTLAFTGVDFLKILNGNHTITIIADDGKATATLALTFTKAVYALSITLATPLSAAAAITKAVTNVARSIPAGATYKVELTNNAADPSPAWEDATAAIANGVNFAFANNTAVNGHKFNFRITAERAPGGDGGYISSIGGAFE